jgi:hypothetical protein
VKRASAEDLRAGSCAPHSIVELTTGVAERQIVSFAGQDSPGTMPPAPGLPLIGKDGDHMTTKPPPVPPANRSDKGPGSATEAPVSQGRTGAQTKDPDKVGQAGNTKVNTTNQGYQQDR